MFIKFAFLDRMETSAELLKCMRESAIWLKQPRCSKVFQSILAIIGILNLAAQDQIQRAVTSI